GSPTMELDVPPNGRPVASRRRRSGAVNDAKGCGFPTLSRAASSRPPTVGAGLALRYNGAPGVYRRPPTVGAGLPLRYNGAPRIYDRPPTVGPGPHAPLQRGPGRLPQATHGWRRTRAPFTMTHRA